MERQTSIGCHEIDYLLLPLFYGFTLLAEAFSIYHH